MSNLKYSNYFPKALILIIFIFSIRISIANPVLQLDDSYSVVALGDYISILEDPQGQLLIEDIIQSKYNENFKRFAQQSPGFGFTKSVFWIKFTLRNNSNNKHWLIDQSFSNTNFLDLYIPNDASTSFIIKKAGNLQSTNLSDLQHRRAIFKIALERNQQRTFYLRLQNNASSKVSLKLWSEFGFSKFDRSESFGMGVFYGLLLVVLFLNLTLFLIFRTSSYGYLTIFIAFISTAYLFLDGYAQLYTPQYLLNLTQHVFHMALALAMLGLMFFMRSMLNLTSVFKYIHTVLAIGWGLIFLLKPFADFGITVKFSIPLLFITIIYLLSLSISNWNSKKVVARIFVFSLLILVFSYASQALVALGVFERSAFSEQGLRLGLIILILMLSVSIIDHVQSLREIWKVTNLALNKSKHLQIESEEKFTKSFYHLPVPMQIFDYKSNTRIAINNSFAELTGYSIEELLDKDIFDTTILSEPNAARTHLTGLIDKGKILNQPLTLIHKNKNPIYTLASGVILDIQDQSLALITFNDISELRLRENALHEIAMGVSATQNGDFFNNLTLQLSKVFSADYVFLGLLDKTISNQINTHSFCKDGVIIDNISYQLTDTPCENVIGQEMCTYPKDVCNLFPKDKMLLDMGIESYIGTPLNDSKGNTIGILVVLKKIPMDDIDNFTQILNIFASRAASEFESYLSNIKFKNAQQKLELHVKQTPLAVIEWNIDFEVVAWNPAAELIFGYSESEAIGKKAKDIIIPQSFRPHVDGVWQNLLSQTGGQRITNENVTKNGSTIICDWYNTPLVTHEGSVIGVASLIADITAEQHTQNELIIKEKQQREILRSMIDGVITINQQGTILSYNNSAQKIMGYTPDEIIGKNISILAPDKITSQFSSNADFVVYLVESHDADKLGSDVQGVRKDKSTFPMRLSIVKLPQSNHKEQFYLGSFQDLTRAKEQEEQLRRSQKMDALGKLTGGIAHDFNNLLGVILGYSDLLNKPGNDSSKLSKYTAQIHKAALRGAELTQKLLGFSRRKQAETSVVDINQLLSAQQHLLDKTLTARINVVFDYQQNLWFSNLDPGDFEDCILNLCINSMHSIENNGQITIQTRNANINQVDAKILQLEAGDYVLVKIIDNGCGMDNNTIEKIFDPFFTTKGELGTGLGLSQVYGFVNSSQGGIKVYSEIGHGTQINLYFPRHNQNRDNQPSPKEAEKVAQYEGTESILVLDDEESIRQLTEEILTQHGYRVICAEFPKDALQVLNSEHIDLLLSDVIMPEMDGYQLADIVLKKFPKIKIQLASGFTDDRHESNQHQEYHKNLLQKPYTATTLLKHIRALLDD